MPDKRDRLILSKATTFASQDSYAVRETDMEYLESLRTDLELHKSEVDDLLDEPTNWYTNHQRSGGTHEFTRLDFFRIKDMLEVEYLRELADIDENEVSRALNNSRGWYEEQLEDGFKIDDFNEVVVFLVTVAILQYEADALNGDLEDLHRVDIVEAEFVEDVQESVSLEF
ncbi:hypothetical protein [Natronobacterium texcoconense]|uniref:Uncharacterized protein n=1 Tax=Natronobacterium texcoconense TaxID=1095778 RepID=A0A1H1IYA4_NATTX|nr:hypothetical protein [Natronobacterium texcoconense]SDR42540.1 hypothetical protein SAMN04489842_3904 [Natronobacterium texcoconense]